VKLTETMVAKLPGKKIGKTDDVILFDDDLPGFGIRIRASGSKTWVFQYKVGLQHRRISLGKYPALHPAQARKTAARLHAEVRLGNDPAAVKAEKQVRATETFGAIARNYLERRRGQVRASTLLEIERHLQRNLAALHDMPLAAIDRRTIANQLARITSAGAPVQANRTRSTLSAFLNWAAREGLIETNAAAFTNKNEEESRDRTLTSSELAQIWRALPAEGDYADILRLLILSGQRATEIADLRWTEINFDRAVIELPPWRVKNNTRHIVPMSPMVCAILKARPQNGRDFVFGTGQGGFSGWSRSKAALDAALKIEPPWVVHDIRRGVASGLAAIGIPVEVIERILNHRGGVFGGIVSVYQKHDFLDEARNALRRWAEHVSASVEGRKSTVRPLRRA
jgi:integrase